jgi:hypothetical protein
MVPIFLQDVIPNIDLPGVNDLIEQSKTVAPNTSGYTFAITLLVVVISVLLYFLRMMWTTIQLKDDKYDLLAQSTTKLLTEVNMKMDSGEKMETRIDLNHEKIVSKVDKVIEMINEKKGCSKI